jgi:hypothetical protein
MKLIFTIAIILSLCQIQTTSRSLSSIRRMLCMNDEVTAYITTSASQARSTPLMKSVVDSMDSPRIPGRRDPPSHIILCEEFLRRKDMHVPGEPMDTQGFHVEEDDAVCRDWSTPHLSLMEIFASTIVGFVSQKYRVTYSHNCQRDLSPDETSDGLEWVTIQEFLPPSGLILDDGSIEEEHVAELCRGCMGGFNAQKQAHEEAQDVDPNDPNPAWFQPHQTHHCILYPGTARPIVNAQEETDMVALTEARAMAQSVPLSNIVDTVKDRLQQAAVQYKMEYGDPPITTSDDRGASGVSRFLSSETQTKRERILAEEIVDIGTNVEETNGAVIYLDEGILPLANATYGKYVPSTVSTIDILISPLCATVSLSNGQKCIEHAAGLEEYMEKLYPDAIVELDIITSTAAAYSRMILAKYLVCPPGATACLFPALAKEDDSFAVVAESPSRANTFHYFNFLDTHDQQLQVAHVDDTTEQSLSVPGMSRAFISDSSTAATTATKSLRVVKHFQ